MKNPYAKTVKLFSKSNDLYIQRAEHVVYICDGHVILKLHVAAYDAFFCPASGQFIEMQDGEKAAKRGNMTLPEKNGNIFDMQKMFDDFKEHACLPVTASPFLMEYTGPKGKNALQRMFTGNGYYIAINDAFYEVARENGFTIFWNDGKPVSPVVASSGDNGIVIMPIRLDQEKLDSFVNNGR